MAEGPIPPPRADSRALCGWIQQVRLVKEHVTDNLRAVQNALSVLPPQIPATPIKTGAGGEKDATVHDAASSCKGQEQSVLAPFDGLATGEAAFPPAQKQKPSALLVVSAYGVGSRKTPVKKPGLEPATAQPKKYFAPTLLEAPRVRSGVANLTSGTPKGDTTSNDIVAGAPWAARVHHSAGSQQQLLQRPRQQHPRTSGQYASSTSAVDVSNDTHSGVICEADEVLSRILEMARHVVPLQIPEKAEHSDTAYRIKEAGQVTGAGSQGAYQSIQIKREVPGESTRAAETVHSRRASRSVGVSSATPLARPTGRPAASAKTQMGTRTKKHLETAARLIDSHTRGPVVAHHSAGEQGSFAEVAHQQDGEQGASDYFEATDAAESERIADISSAAGSLRTTQNTRITGKVVANTRTPPDACNTDVTAHTRVGTRTERGIDSANTVGDNVPMQYSEALVSDEDESWRVFVSSLEKGHGKLVPVFGMAGASALPNVVVANTCNNLLNLLEEQVHLNACIDDPEKIKSLSVEEAAYLCALFDGVSKEVECIEAVVNSRSVDSAQIDTGNTGEDHQSNADILDKEQEKVAISEEELVVSSWLKLPEESPGYPLLHRLKSTICAPNNVLRVSSVDDLKAINDIRCSIQWEALHLHFAHLAMEMTAPYLLSSARMDPARLIAPSLSEQGLHDLALFRFLHSITVKDGHRTCVALKRERAMSFSQQNQRQGVDTNSGEADTACADKRKERMSQDSLDLSH